MSKGLEDAPKQLSAGLLRHLSQTRPLDDLRRATRVWNFITLLFNQLGLRPPIYWPEWLSKTLLVDHHGNRERFRLCYVLWRNGLPPAWFWTICAIYDVRKAPHSHTVILPGVWASKPDFDRHIRQMMAQAEDGQWLHSTTEYYDIERAEVERQPAPL